MPDEIGINAENVAKVQSIPVRSMEAEVGMIGLNRWGGSIREEFLTELQGRRGYEKYREMLYNSTAVASTMFALEQVLLSAEWNVTPGEGPDGEKAADFVRECMHDMMYTWHDTMTEALSFLPFGFSVMEIVLKHRRGRTPGLSKGRALPISQYDDGKIGWSKFAIRGQETLYGGWKIDDYGVVLGVAQTDPFSGKSMFLPRLKLLHFRTKAAQGNPEGMPLLRWSYRPYFFQTKLEEYEAIGIERNTAGMPKIQPAEGVDLWNPSDPAMVQGLAYARRLVTAVRRDENMGIVLPFGWTFELVSSGGADPIEVGKVIDRYKWDISKSILAYFLESGRQATGSYAKQVSDIALFLKACRGWHKLMATEMQQQAVDPLVTVYNKFNLDKTPQLQPSDVSEQAIEDMAESIVKLASGGFLTPDEATEVWVRQKLGMPEKTEEEIIEIKDKRQEQALEISQGKDKDKDEEEEDEEGRGGKKEEEGPPQGTRKSASINELVGALEE